MRWGGSLPRVCYMISRVSRSRSRLTLVRVVCRMEDHCSAWLSTLDRWLLKHYLRSCRENSGFLQARDDLLETVAQFNWWSFPHSQPPRRCPRARIFVPVILLHTFSGERVHSFTVTLVGMVVYTPFPALLIHSRRSFWYQQTKY